MPLQEQITVGQKRAAGLSILARSGPGERWHRADSAARSLRRSSGKSRPAGSGAHGNVAYIAGLCELSVFQVRFFLCLVFYLFILFVRHSSP